MHIWNERTLALTTLGTRIPIAIMNRGSRNAEAFRLLVLFHTGHSGTWFSVGLSIQLNSTRLLSLVPFAIYWGLKRVTSTGISSGSIAWWLKACALKSDCIGVQLLAGPLPGCVRPPCLALPIGKMGMRVLTTSQGTPED